MPGFKTPVPESPRTRVGFDPFELMEMLPLIGPLLRGVKVTLNVVLWEGLRVSGNVKPVWVKPDPLSTACDIVRLDPPELVRISDTVRLPPTCIFPKLKLCGLATSWPTVTPEPETDTVEVE